MKLRCDWNCCMNPAFMEVDYEKANGEWVWSNLCLPHFFLEKYIRKIQFGYCFSQVWYSHFWNTLWTIICKITH